VDAASELKGFGLKTTGSDVDKRARPDRKGVPVDERREHLRQRQREAIWKWRWLGLRDATPGFKGSLILLAAAAAYLVVRVLTSV
jgi:hypothetical protein